MNTKAVIFDKDGVLLDFDAFWLPVGITATKTIMEQLGCEAIPPEKMLAAIGVENGSCSIEGVLCRGTYGEIAEKMQEVMCAHGFEVSLETVTSATVEAYHACTGEGTIQPSCDDIVAVMEEIKAQGIIIALVTSDDSAMTRRSLEELGIAKYFDAVYTDDGTHPNKPDPYCINELSAEFDIEKSQMVMVGDSLSDMTFAANGGIRGIGIARTSANREILLGKTDTVIGDISLLMKVLR